MSLRRQTFVLVFMHLSTKRPNGTAPSPPCMNTRTPAPNSARAMCRIMCHICLRPGRCSLTHTPRVWNCHTPHPSRRLLCCMMNGMLSLRTFCNFRDQIRSRPLGNFASAPFAPRMQRRSTVALAMHLHVRPSCRIHRCRILHRALSKLHAFALRHGRIVQQVWHARSAALCTICSAWIAKPSHPAAGAVLFAMTPSFAHGSRIDVLFRSFLLSPFCRTRSTSAISFGLCH